MEIDNDKVSNDGINVDELILHDEFVIVINEIENVVREYYKKKFNLKKRHTFNNSPILREKILEFIEKCYTGDVFFYEIMKTGEETVNCRDCGTEMAPGDNYCVLCGEIKEMGTDGYNRLGRIGGEEIIKEAGAQYSHYTTGLVSQVNPNQTKIASKLNSIGIRNIDETEIEPKSIPSGIKSMKEAGKWVKIKYAQQLISDREKLEKFMSEFKLGTDLVKIKNEIETIIKDDPKMFSESGYQVLSDEIKSSLKKANVGEQLYKTITQKLKSENLLGGNLILDNINLAILDWTINNMSKADILSKYKLTSKANKAKFGDMIRKWFELGIITLPQRGYGGPNLTFEYSSINN